MQNTSIPGRFVFKKQDFVFLLIFIFIVIILIISTNLTGRPPEIKSLNKNICQPGEMITLYGKYFGGKRDNSKVTISGKYISFKYQEWRDNKISIIVPDDMPSGLVNVITSQGESKEIILLLNEKELPEIAGGPSKPGEPALLEVTPGKGTPGSVITLTGLNFGQHQASSNVYFTWISDDKKSYDKDNLFSSLIPALDYDFDIINWSDREIKLRIADGAAPGPILLATDKGVSSPLYLEVLEPIGRKTYTDQRTYQISYTINIKNINSEQDNGLYLWLPRIADSPEQREIRIIYNEPAPQLENYKGLMQYFFEDLLPGGKYEIKLSFMFHRYTVNTVIANPAKISNKDNVSSQYLTQYTHAEDLIPAAEPVIKNLMKKINNTLTDKRLNTNPYYQARAVYDYLARSVTFTDNKFTRSTNLVERIQSQAPEGNAMDLSLLFCALLRSDGIPARPVGGYLINDAKINKPHVWAEFYLENLGWVPVDIVLGTGKMLIELPLQDKPEDFYFGNLDNNHITFSKGIIQLNQMNPRGKITTGIKSPSLQSIYEESVGSLHSYSSEWSMLEDIGIY